MSMIVERRYSTAEPAKLFCTQRVRSKNILQPRCQEGGDGAAVGSWEEWKLSSTKNKRRSLIISNSAIFV
jgi:hypothetical protein